MLACVIALNVREIVAIIDAHIHRAFEEYNRLTYKKKSGEISPLVSVYMSPALLFAIVPLMLLIPATTINGNALTRSVQLKMPPPAHCKTEFV
jgi:hypothetical protein